MTLTEMITAYNTFTKAVKYIIGFVLANNVYYFMDDEIPFDFFKLDHASSARGGMAKVRIRLNKEAKLNLVYSGKAVKIGVADDLLDETYNKGLMFEKIITETFTNEKWVKDSLPFWMGGDITLNGEEVQIKFDGAELTNEKTLARLMA